MDTRRLFLYLALGLILLLLWQRWHAEHPAPVQHPATPAASSTAAAENQAATPAATPAAASPGKSTPQAAAVTSASSGAISIAAPTGPKITVHTDVLNVAIALHGGQLTRATLLKYPEKLHSKEKVSLLAAGTSQGPALMVKPELHGSGLPANPAFTASAKQYRLAKGQDTLRVPLTWHGNGITVQRVLVFKRGSYQVQVQTSIENSSGKALSVVPGIRMVGSNPEVAKHFWDHFLPKYYAYRGPAYYNGNDGYEKVTIKDLDEKSLDKQFSGGWIASVKQYFVAAAIPKAHEQARYFARTRDGKYALGYNLAPLTVTAGNRASTDMRLFLGPKKQGLLKQIAPGLPRTVDYGKATILCKPIFAVLSFIHGILGNWGWSIIILVLLIKALFYFPQRMSARSLAKMRKLQPRIKLLRERYKDDRQKLSQATMQLYKEEGANPVGGCLPMLIQIPIFIGLFYVLIFSVELRQAPWILWIHDLSQPDPFYVLPIIYAALSFIQFRLQPQAMDNAQAKMMMVMPLLFAFFYALFPSGLVLYYTLSTGLNIAIQYQVNHELGMKGLGVLPKINWPGGKKGG